MEKFSIHISFDPDLGRLLHPGHRNIPFFDLVLNRRTSAKDLIESLRVPHTEIGKILVNDRHVDFSYAPAAGDNIQVLSPECPVDPRKHDPLRPTPLSAIRFLVDVNVAKLGSLLRMTGFDCTCHPHFHDAEIAETAFNEERILLSRDRNLLKRKIVIHGHLVRSHRPDRQLQEVFKLYGLYENARPFSRCLSCNALLIPIAKDQILHRLEPLTKKYYSDFHRCPGCDNIYWSGSHKDNMEELLARILNEAETPPI